MDHEAISYVGTLVIWCMVGGFIGTVGGAALGHLFLWIGGKIKDRIRKTDKTDSE